LRRPPIKGYLFDLDGTLVLGDRTGKSYDVLPGAIEVLSHLRERGVPYVVLTNGSGHPPTQQAARLRSFGLPVEDSRLFTPSSVTAEVFARAGIRRVLVLGTPGVGHVLKEQGISITFTGEIDCEKVDAVYIGWHPHCGMPDIAAACNAIWNGARLYVASDVPFFASRSGRTIGYSYAINGAVRRMTGVRAIITGKPSQHALRFVARRLGVKVHEVGVVGDDPVVEMSMARRGGATGFGVCTGTTSRAQWLKQPLLRRPHHVIQGVYELLERGWLK
jgi:HAD superfamily hydrolase (TIGR01450 family)